MSAIALLHATFVMTSSAGTVSPLAVDGDHLLLHHLVARESIPAGIDPDFRLMRVPKGHRSITLTVEAQRKLLKRRLPNVKLAPRTAQAIEVTFARKTPAEDARPCFELGQPLEGGAWIGAEHIRQTACDDGRRAAPLAYDAAARAPRTLSALAAGSYVGRIVVPSRLPLPKGSELTLHTRVGPVAVDRNAVLEQPARPGRRAFVRLSDGSIIAAKLADEGTKP